MLKLIVSISLILGAQSGSAADKASGCTDCHDNINTGPVVHAPIKSWGCFVCHLKDTKGKVKLKEDMPEDHPKLLPIDSVAINDTCLMCHDKTSAKLKKSKNKHAAIEGGCLSCHLPHNSKFKSLLKAQSPGLCLECHDDIKKAMGSKFKHAMIEDEGSCMNCHDPHASSLPKLTKAAAPEMCGSCHDVELKKVKHSPVADGDCAGCHAPHGGPEHAILKKSYPAESSTKFEESKYALCWDCHGAELVTAQKTTDATEFRNGDRNLHFVHVKDVRNPMSCRACHDAHSATQAKLIAKNAPFRDYKIYNEFEQAKDGGSCATACHMKKAYNRVKAVQNPAGR